ncbi:MAG: trypsin-like peptidase domain-containing protein [Candidatus Dormibacteraeota bacterium]|uniref:Trypsin-like peptidase domain-containing protein n=1 Tax=Candidatus Aeolococcus gillhamiae TaxID=3127015 RepID=A0A934NAM4_9BACT|nr:trypsin-like peptidase domain-containing protein [Candidatus Dormibacteraeota bacterium]
MSRRRQAASSRPLRLLLAVGAVVLAGVIAFLVTVNRTAVPGAAPSASHPPVVRVVAPSPTLSLDDIARAHLDGTVTIEALGSNDEGLGTGWLLDAKGDFVTNAHVVQGQLSVRIRARNGSSHVGAVMGIDRDLDIAVIRSRDGFAGTPLTPFKGTVNDFPISVVALASSNATGHGDITDERVTRVESTVPVTGDTTTGQPPTTTEYHDMLVLDGLPIYPGNSGGPVLDAQGRVVGIVTLASKSLPEGYAIQMNRVIAELTTFAAR